MPSSRVSPLRCWGFCPVSAAAPTHEILAVLGPEYTFVERMLAVNTVVVRGPCPAVLPEKYRCAPGEPLAYDTNTSHGKDLHAFSFTPKAETEERPVTDVVMVHVVMKEVTEQPPHKLWFRTGRALHALEEIGFDMPKVKKVFGVRTGCEPAPTSRRRKQPVRTPLFYVQMASPGDALAALGRWDACYSAVAGGFVHVHQLCTSTFNEVRANGNGDVWYMTRDYARTCTAAACCLKARVPLRSRAIGYGYPKPARVGPKERLYKMFPRTPAETVRRVLKSVGHDVDKAAAYLEELGGGAVQDTSSEDDDEAVVARAASASEPADADADAEARPAACQRRADLEPVAVTAAREAARPAPPIARQRCRRLPPTECGGGAEAWGPVGPAEAHYSEDPALYSENEHWDAGHCGHPYWIEYAVPDFVPPYAVEAEYMYMYGSSAAAPAGCPYDAYPAPPPPPPALYSHPSEAGSGSGDGLYVHMPYAIDEPEGYYGAGAWARSGPDPSALPPQDQVSMASSTHSVVRRGFTQSCPPMIVPCCAGGGGAQTVEAGEVSASSDAVDDFSTEQTLPGLESLPPTEGSSAGEDGHDEGEARGLTRSCPDVPLTAGFGVDDEAPIPPNREPLAGPCSPCCAQSPAVDAETQTSLPRVERAGFVIDDSDSSDGVSPASSLWSESEQSAEL